MAKEKTSIIEGANIIGKPTDKHKKLDTHQNI